MLLLRECFLEGGVFRQIFLQGNWDPSYSCVRRRVHHLSVLTSDLFTEPWQYSTQLWIFLCLICMFSACQGTFFLAGLLQWGHILQVMARGADWRTARGCWEATCCWHHLAEVCAQSFPSSYQTSALYEITDDLLFLQLICCWFPLAPNNKWEEEPSSAWKCMALSLLPICPLGIKMAVWWKLKHSLENISGLSKFILSFLFLPCFCLVRSQHTFVLP